MYPDIERGQRQMSERLRALPTEAQPPYDWLEFQRRTEQLRAPARAGFTRLPYAAAASLLLLLLAVGSAALMTHRRATHAVAHVVRPAASQYESESLGVVADARTQATERWLASLPSEPVIVRFGTRVAVTSLEDRIAQVDDLLTTANFERAQPARLVALQQERGRLVNSLAQVRYAEALAANAP